MLRVSIFARACEIINGFYFCFITPNGLLKKLFTITRWQYKINRIPEQFRGFVAATENQLQFHFDFLLFYAFQVLHIHDHILKLLAFCLGLKVFREQRTGIPGTKCKQTISHCQ